MQIFSESDIQSLLSGLQYVTSTIQKVAQQSNSGNDKSCSPESTAIDEITKPIAHLTNFIEAKTPQHYPSELEKQGLSSTLPIPCNKRQSSPTCSPIKKRLKQVEGADVTDLNTPKIPETLTDFISKYVCRNVFFFLKCHLVCELSLVGNWHEHASFWQTVVELRLDHLVTVITTFNPFCTFFYKGNETTPFYTSDGTLEVDQLFNIYLGCGDSQNQQEQQGIFSTF